MINDDNKNLELNLNSFTENEIKNKDVKNNISSNDDKKKDIEPNQDKNCKKRTKGTKKKKKKRKNRHIRILCRNKSYQKSNEEIKEQKSDKNDTQKISETQGKILTKIYLQQLAKKKKIYAEKVKLMKIYKRHTSAKIKDNSSALDLIKQYSQKVYNTNREIINIQRKKEEEKEQEQEKELLKILGIKNIERLKSELSNKELYSSIRLNTNSSGSIPLILLKKNQLINSSSNGKIILKNLNINKRYYYELRRCESSGLENSIAKKNHDINNINAKSVRNNNLIKIQINNSVNQSNLFKKDKYRAKSPTNSRNEAMNRMINIRILYQRQTVSESVKEFKRLYYSILPGNASYLVKNCMCHRTNWKEAFSYATNFYNFKWQQISYNIDYSVLGRYGAIKQVVNHFENHCAISNKANMFINLMNYCEQRKISVFKYVPFTIIFELKTEDKLNEEEKQRKYLRNLEKLKSFIDKAENLVINYNKIGKYFQDEKFIQEKKNRIEFFKEKNPKKRRYHSSEDIYEEDIKDYKGEFLVYRDLFKKIKLLEKVPTLLRNYYSFSFEKYKEEKKKLEKSIGTNTVLEIPDTHFNGRNMWVIKAINLNRGMCIKIVNNFKEMVKILNQFKDGVDYDFTEKIEEETISIEKDENNKESNNRNENKKEVNNKKKEDEKSGGSQLYYCSKIIIQKYIEKPLLYKGRKCDIRIWVLISYNMKIYFFKEGHLKTCSIEYDIYSKDAYSHITNYSFQKHNDNFQKYEKGNEVPFYEFQRYIDENYPDRNYKLNKDLKKQIKEIVELTTRSVKDQINKNERNYQFEIFGYDFMLDENFNLFLIEINTNPGLEESSPWIKIIVPRMLDDSLRLTLDQLFNPEYDFSKIYKNEEEKENRELVLNNLKNKISPNSPDFITENNINKDNDRDFNLDKVEKISNSHLQTEVDNASNANNIEKKNEEVKDNNNSGYITPFPVPGYSDNENLWEFVCDLNSKDPLDDFLDEDDKKDKDYSGINFLFNQKKDKENIEEENKLINKNLSESIENNKEKNIEKEFDENQRENNEENKKNKEDNIVKEKINNEYIEILPNKTENKENEIEQKDKMEKIN